MRIGTLRHLLTIEAPTATANDYGEPVEGWATFAQVYGSREDLTGREALMAQQIASDVTTRFTMRHLAGVTSKMRIRTADVVYGIESVQDPDGRNRQLVLMAKRVS